MKCQILCDVIYEPPENYFDYLKDTGYEGWVQKMNKINLATPNKAFIVTLVLKSSF